MKVDFHPLNQPSPQGIHAGPASWVAKGPMLGLMPGCTALKVLVIFEQGALHFHFELGRANDAACLNPSTLSLDHH